MVIKGGVIAWANMGDPNASIPTPEPVNLYFPLIMIFMKQQSPLLVYLYIVPNSALQFFI